MQLLTAAQMRAIEADAIESGSVTGLELMERAGRGVVEALFAEWPELLQAPHRAVVLCGPGNNGGDGFVIARVLKDWGWQVDVHLFGAAEKLPPDARTNHDRWGRLGAVTAYDDAAFEIKAGEDGAEVVLVDALFGTGLVRPVTGFDRAARMTRQGRAGGAGPGIRIVAVDIPSGLDADSGRYLAVEDPEHADFRADLTVTFHSAKLGHVLAGGPAACGRIRTVDIGLRPRSEPAIARAVEAPEAAALRKTSAAHKYSHGHALILAGGPGRGGAARLAARGALRIGAGLVTVGCPPDALTENAARLDAIMLREVADAGVLERILEDARFSALCLGPGLGLDEAARALVAAALAADRPTVLDADALTAHAEDPAALFDQLHPACVLTPHAGEFARLFPDLAEVLAAPAVRGPAPSRVEATRAAAARAGCTVLLKGPDTVIAGPKGAAAVHVAAYDRAAPWLATAGAGDVLAGFVAGLLARGLPPQNAAEAAVWLHVDCALRVGPGLTAEDLPEALLQVFSALGL